MHIAGAVIWIGGAFFIQVYGMVELASRDTAAIARFAGSAGNIGTKLFTPVSLLVVLAGIGLMLEGNWDWGRMWVLFGIGAFTGSFLLGFLVLGPTAKQIATVGPETDEGQRLIRRVFSLLRVDLLFMFAIVFAMTVKPTSDDGWTVAIAAVVLLAGAALFLARLREPTSEPASSAGRVGQ